MQTVPKRTAPDYDIQRSQRCQRNRRQCLGSRAELGTLPSNKDIPRRTQALPPPISPPQDLRTPHPSRTSAHWVRGLPEGQGGREGHLHGTIQLWLQCPTASVAERCRSQPFQPFFPGFTCTCLGKQSPPTPPRQAGAVTSRDFAATSLQPLSWHRPWPHASPGQQGLPPFHPQGRACPLEPRLPEECLQEARRAWSRLPSSASHHLLMGLRLRGRWEPNSKGSRWFCSHR